MSPRPPLPRKVGGYDPLSSYGSAAPGSRPKFPDRSSLSSPDQYRIWSGSAAICRNYSRKIDFSDPWVITNNNIGWKPVMQWDRKTAWQSPTVDGFVHEIISKLNLCERQTCTPPKFNGFVPFPVSIISSNLVKIPIVIWQMLAKCLSGNVRESEKQSWIHIRNEINSKIYSLLESPLTHN